MRLQNRRRIETARLTLRTPIPSDLDALAAILSDPEVMRSYLFGKPFSEAEIRRTFLPSVREHNARYGFGALTMCLRPSGAVIGLTGLSYPSIFPNVQLGWVIAKDYWHRGFAFESGCALLAYGLETLRLTRIEATTRADNAAAIAAIERLGMMPGASFVQDGVALTSYYAALTLERGVRVSS